MRIVWADRGPRTLGTRQRLDERLALQPDERALMTVLLLRGAQAPGELRTRTERLHPFADREQVEAVLRRLAALPTPLVRASWSASPASRTAVGCTCWGRSRWGSSWPRPGSSTARASWPRGLPRVTPRCERPTTPWRRRTPTASATRLSAQALRPLAPRARRRAGRGTARRRRRHRARPRRGLRRHHRGGRDRHRPLAGHDRGRRAAASPHRSSSRSGDLRRPPAAARRQPGGRAVHGVVRARPPRQPPSSRPRDRSPSPRPLVAGRLAGARPCTRGPRCTHADDLVRPAGRPRLRPARPR